MKLRTFVVLAAALLIAADTPKADVTRTEGEFKKLQGTWILARGEEVGSEITEKDAKEEPLVLVIKEGKISVNRDNKPAGELGFTIDPSKKPAEMDFISTEGEKKGKKEYAIYALEGDELTICLAGKFRFQGEPRKRPTKFSTKEDTEGRGLLLLVFKRKK
jgi:uncharacterized protein (TIGR03067 family)